MRKGQVHLAQSTVCTFHSMTNSLQFVKTLFSLIHIPLQFGWNLLDSTSLIFLSSWFLSNREDFCPQNLACGPLTRSINLPQPPLNKIRDDTFFFIWNAQSNFVSLIILLLLSSHIKQYQGMLFLFALCLSNQSLSHNILQTSIEWFSTSNICSLLGKQSIFCNHPSITRHPLS